MRRNKMRVGERYEMQRGPTRRPVPVSLISKDAPSGRSYYVLVRIEAGIGKGNEREVPSAAIYPLAGSEIPKKKVSKLQRKPPMVREAPAGWLPSPGEIVTWAQTLDLRLTVLEVDEERGVAKLEGKEIFGMEETYEALMTELCPYQPVVELVAAQDIEERLGDRLPEKVGRDGGASSRQSPPVESREQREDLVARLIFAPQLLTYYARRFAYGATPPEAETRLRSELSKADPIRKRHTGEYLRLRVKRRFDVVLDHRPVQGDFKSCYVTKLRLPAKSRRIRKAA